MWKKLTALAFVSHATIGNMCMMPMAFAQEMPMSHEEHMEMVMTPMLPMSPAHCEHCVKVRNSEEPPRTSDCAGHCVSRASEAKANAIFSNAQQLITAPALPMTIDVVAQEASVRAPSATAPPTLRTTDTIVLRL